MRLRWWFTLALANIIFVGPVSQVLAQERVIGVVPQGAPSNLVQQWQPLIKYLEDSTGINLRFSTAPSITRFEQRVLKGEYDFVYMNSLLYVRAHKQLGYQALVRRHQPMRGIIVVDKAKIKNLEELNGATIAFPSPTAFGATLLTRSELDRRGIKYHVSYVSNHETGYKSVLVGQNEAAGGVLRTFSLMPEKSRSKLRILFKTRPVTGHVIAANPRVPRAESQRVAKALRALSHNTTGRQLLDKLKIDRFVAAKSGDFSAVSNMSYPTTRNINELKLLVIPRLSEAVTRKQMIPLISYIHQKLELDLKLETFPTMGAFDRAIEKVTGPALINANPLQAIKLSKMGYTVIAQQTPLGSPEGMRGLILVAKDSPIKSIADLQDRRIAFGGNRNAFFANIVPRVILSRNGMQGKYKNLSEPGPVSDVIRRLHNGEIDAAGAGTMALRSQQLIDKYQVDQMRVIARSEPMPGLAWLVSKDVPAGMKAEIQDVLLNFGPHSPGHRSMTSAGVASIRPATIKSYSPVEQYIREGARLK